MDDETSLTGMLSPEARDSLLREETRKTRHQFEADSHEDSASYVTRQAFAVADSLAANGIDHRAILMAASQSARSLRRRTVGGCARGATAANRTMASSWRWLVGEGNRCPRSRRHAQRFRGVARL